MSVPYLPAERVTAQDNIRRCDDNVGYWKRLGLLVAKKVKYEYLMSIVEVGWERFVIYREIFIMISSDFLGFSTNKCSETTTLKFYITSPMRFTFFLFIIEIFERLTEVYADEVVDERVYRWITNLKSAVARELSIQKQLCQTIGALEFIINSGRIITSPNLIVASVIKILERRKQPLSIKKLRLVHGIDLSV
uniref:DUF629 domain-containing protein n=1 Tax=Heterorhabditis bacteriophora TaxID=37862 RepID=A0A1I7WM03_HETBA